MDQPLIPDLSVHHHAVRRLADAILECIDTAIDSLSEVYDLPDADTPEGEDALAELAERLLNLATTGEA